MEHFNKQLEVNLNNNSDLNKNSITEGVIILFLIVLGFAGLYFCSGLNQQPSTNNNYPPFTMDDSTYDRQEKDIQALQPKEAIAQKLIIKGYKEAGEKISFIIDGFDTKAGYTIDFGDGIQKSSQSEKIEHTYDRPGDYDVNLNVTYSDQKTQKIKKKISIEDSIEVLEDAHHEQ